MVKIKDTIALGITAGLAANLFKGLSEGILNRKGWMKITAPQKAASILLAPKHIGSPRGLLVGAFTDCIIAALLGVIGVYLFKATGTDKKILKGLLLGHTSWSMMYGVLASMGAARLKPEPPQTVLGSLLSHSLFGIAKMALICKLGDPALFNKKMPAGLQK